MAQKHYMNYSRYELCEALDTPLFDKIGEAAINESGETFALLNHWSIYNYYASQGIYPIAESKYWLLYECGVVQGEDEGFGIMMEADCIPFEGYSDSYESLLRKFISGSDSIADVLVRITTTSKQVKSYAKSLLKRLNPTETEAALDKMFELGMELADTLNDFIKVLELEVKLRGI